MFVIMKYSLAAIFCALFLSACATGDSVSGNADEAAQTLNQLIGDMPTPNGAQLVPSKSLIIGGGDQWVGRAVLNSARSQTEVYAFFQSEYPKAGWNTVTATKSKTSILVFTKGDRTATVEIGDGDLAGPKSQITITLSPKSANIIAPNGRR